MFPFLKFSLSFVLNKKNRILQVVNIIEKYQILQVQYYNSLGYLNVTNEKINGIHKMTNIKKA